MRLRVGCRKFTYDSSPGGADEGMGLSDSGETFYAGGGGSDSTGITYAADAWTGWANEISVHSAGLESYTAPSEPGQPGITTLTDAGLAALGISREQAPITYSWFDNSGVKTPILSNPLAAIGLDPTTLLNTLVSSISNKIVSLQDGLAKLVTDVTTPIKAGIDSAISTLTTTIRDVIGAVNEIGQNIGNSVSASILSISKAIAQVGYDAGQYLSAVFDPLLRSVSAGLEYVRNALNQITSTITSTIQQATQAAAAAVQVTLSQVTSGLTELQADLEGLPQLIMMFKTPDLFGEFLIKSLAAAWDKEV